MQALARALSQLVDGGACQELLSGEVAVWEGEGNRWGTRSWAVTWAAYPALAVAPSEGAS